MLTHLSLPDVPEVARRTMVSALVVGVVALVVAVLVDHALFGLGTSLGLALGVVNFRLIGNSVVKHAQRGEGKYRGPMAVNTAGRMAVLTAIALGLLFVNFQLGFGVIAGMAVFQMVLLVNAARSMIKANQLAAFDGGVIDGVGEPVVDPRPSVGQPVPGERSEEV
jgi:hypothetical protein